MNRYVLRSVTIDFVYMPDKPYPYSFKFFVLCSVSGYEIYSGAVDMILSENRMKGESDLCSSSNVVV